MFSQLFLYSVLTVSAPSFTNSIPVELVGLVPVATIEAQTLYYRGISTLSPTHKRLIKADIGCRGCILAADMVWHSGTTCVDWNFVSSHQNQGDGNCKIVQQPSIHCSMDRPCRIGGTLYVTNHCDDQIYVTNFGGQSGQWVAVDSTVPISVPDYDLSCDDYGWQIVTVITNSEGDELGYIKLVCDGCQYTGGG